MTKERPKIDLDEYLLIKQLINIFNGISPAAQKPQPDDPQAIPVKPRSPNKPSPTDERMKVPLEEAPCVQWESVNEPFVWPQEPQ